MRVTNLQAALGLAQLERLDATTERKRRMGRRYTEKLEGLKDVQFPLAATEKPMFVPAADLGLGKRVKEIPARPSAVARYPEPATYRRPG